MNKTRGLVEDWQLVRDKIEKYAWAKTITQEMKEKTDWWVANYQDDPSRASGWMHNYFCENCSVGIPFDPAKPGEHVCTKCGKSRQDDLAHEAWNGSYRSSACTQVFHAAVLYNIYEDPKYMAFIRKVLAFYSEHLPELTVKTPEKYVGRFSGINLSDAVGICNLLNGMELVKEQFTEEELSVYKNQFFSPMAEFLHKKEGGTPNISCWMKSALGMSGLFFNEPKWCELAAEGKEGIKPIVAQGLLPSGFWYESSFHYHFYGAEGLTYYAAFCKLYNYDFPFLTESILSMYRYPTLYAFPDGRFPSPNDGWPNRSFSHYAHQYEWIRNMFDEAPFRYALSLAYNEDNIGRLPRLLFGGNWDEEKEAYEREHQTSITPARISRCDNDIYYAMLQNEQASVFFKYGFILGGHSHADIMNFEIYYKDDIIARDISNSGYSTELFVQWQRKSIAHNTVMVDQKNQPNRPRGDLIEFDESQNKCQAAAKDIYPGVDFSRSLQLVDDRLIDEFKVSTDDQQEHTLDWFFHCSGELEHSLPMKATSQPGTEDGYQLMQDVQSCNIDGDWQISWKLPDKKLTLSMTGCPGTEVYIFRGYEHQADLLRWGVMVRRTGQEAEFKAVYKMEEN